MKKLLLFWMLSGIAIGQPLNYYTTCFNQDSTELKDALHLIIQDHTELDYGTIKTVIRQADEDPSNTNNVLLLYTGNSINKWDFANNPWDVSQFDFWNREHVWAKSHGDFGPNGIYTDKGANTDAHHLRPVDMTMNSSRGYKDFDEGGSMVSNGGVNTDCYMTTDTWEPRDEVKGDVARMLFYMASRYEGGFSDAGDPEPDLELVDSVGTFPNPKMGKLSTLLSWHEEDPVDAWEMNRNDVIYAWQGNRNPFIDHPEYVEIIWGDSDPTQITIENVLKSPVEPDSTDDVTVTADINVSAGSIDSVRLFWGTDWDEVLEEDNELLMNNTGGTTYSAVIPSQEAGVDVYFKIQAVAGFDTAFVTHNFQIAPEPFVGTITSIYSIQGQALSSPYAASSDEFSITGIVTFVDGDNFFLQEATGPWTGIYVYQSGSFPQLGDSVIVTGEVKEYYGLTELTNISAFYPVSTGHILPEPNIIVSGEVENGSSTAEQYEGTIVNIQIAACTEDVQSFGLWEVDDGTGVALVHNNNAYSYSPVIGEDYEIRGVLNYNYGEYKIELRSTEDVGPGLDIVAPEIVSADIFENGKITLVLSENMLSNTVENISNYSLSNGVQVYLAEQDDVDSSIVYLSVSNLVEGDILLGVGDCKDLAGNPVDDTVLVNSTFNNLSLEEEAEEVLKLFSSDGLLYIHTIKPCSSLRIYSIEGREIYRINDLKTNFSTNLNTGFYLIEYRRGKYRYTESVIVR